LSGAIFLTGAGGFVGRRMVRELTAAGRPVFALVRPSSPVPPELQHAGVRLLRGDLRRPDLGLLPGDLQALRTEASDVIHVAAARDPRDRAEAAEINVEGTARALELARKLPRLRRFVHVSSISVAGDYPGRFYEDWLDVGQSFPTLYAWSKYQAEDRVRRAADLPVVIVRPGSIVGDSTTGESDPVASALDKAIAALWRVRKVPRFVPLPRPFPRRRLFPLVPVDYVARATLALALTPAPRATTYCLIDPSPPRLEAVMNHLSDRLGAPRLSLEVPLGALRTVTRLPGLETGLEKVRFPVSSLAYLDCTLEFDDHNAEKALAPSGIRCPSFFQYADILIDGYLARTGVA
jgi:nucleoside-diphosphate-sugar epimerase